MLAIIERSARKHREFLLGFALQILQRRLASSPAAFHESLKRRLARLEGRLQEEKLGRVASRPGDGDGIASSGFESALDEDDLEEATGEEIEAHEERLLDRATAAQTIAEAAFAEAGGVLRARETGRFEVTRVPPFGLVSRRP